MDLTQVLNAISQGLLYPVIVTLIVLVAITVVLLVMTVVEYFTERRLFKVSVPAFLRQIEESDCQSIPGIIANADIIKRQKLALMALFNVRDLPEEARWNTAKRAVYETTKRYDTLTSIAEFISRAAPMVGLMGTLIPLGPGIDALSTGDMATLAGSLLIAFDTTVVGLVSAVLCLLIVKIRRRWNSDYSNALEAMQSTLFDHIAELEEQGDLEYSAPLALEEDKSEKAKNAGSAKEKDEASAEEAATTEAEPSTDDVGDTLEEKGDK